MTQCDCGTNRRAPAAGGEVSIETVIISLPIGDFCDAGSPLPQN
jgi:hypothetical protein